MARSITKTARPTKGARRPRVRGLVLMTDDRAPAMRRDDDLVPKTQAQADYVRSIMTNKLTFGIGPAGTGKSFVAASIAAARLEAREIDRIIITRPAVEAGESLGFLPGTMEEKVAPYFAPIRMILERRLGKSAVEMFVKNGKIEFLPLAFMRGVTLERAFIILDEAQNTTPAQMKLLLTRIGEDTTTVVDGDVEQSDLPGLCGLADALGRIRSLRGVGVVEFTDDDIVRSGLVMDIIKAYRK